MTTLTEQAEEYAEPLAEDLRRVVRRAFMAGALAALTKHEHNRVPDRH